jgi:formylglycine-generating enzyme required for sulfatase activity
MGQTASTCLLGLMLSGMVAFAAEPTGPRTLENLLAATDAEPQAAVVADEAPNEAEEPPAARKKDPLQQRLDAALAEYNPAIERAIDELANEIEEEFNKATKKGDIGLARKCKEAEVALRERGTPPDNDFLKHAREDTYRKITRAGAKLAAEFEAVAKECLKAGDLDRAEAVLSEKAELMAEMKGWTSQSTPAPRTHRLGNASPAGERRRITNSFGMQFVPIPAGQFLMGDPEVGVPPVRVVISQAYLIGTTEVTQEQWEHVMGNSPWTGTDVEADAKAPAANLSWDEVTDFCSRLTALERERNLLAADEEYRLPTEAEWEYACRAGTSTRWCWGNQENGGASYAWYQSGPTAVDRARAVAAKSPNAWGLYDAHGNVWEWCSDWDGALTGGLDPKGPADGTNRVRRGGGFHEAATPLRSGWRANSPPGHKSAQFGFRVVKSRQR